MLWFLTYYSVTIILTNGFSETKTSNSGNQIDAVLLDELLREIVDSSMSTLRHRLQEAVFATAFRRRILEQDSFSSKNVERMSEKIDKILLDDYIKPQKLSLALETFTTTVPSIPLKKVQLVTASPSEMGGASESSELFEASGNDPLGRMFDDVDNRVATSSLHLPRVPVWIAVMVCLACVLTFCLLIGTIVYFVSVKRSKKRGKRDFAMIPDTVTVQGLCHTSPHGPMTISNFSNSRRNSFIIDQDRAASSIWAQP